MPNRLSDAISPYVRSHADNPVEWWPWGAEAFAEARERGVPVFISIGYASCHWCHVMARESFSDPMIAHTLSQGFVAVKLDREEFPDVDSSYMAAASAYTENLGWPLSIFATPDGDTFFAGSYFPPEPASGLPSFRQVLDAVTTAWTVRPDEVASAARAVTAALGARSPSPAAIPDGTGAAVARLLQGEDALHGGFGGAPKFPVAPVLNFLLGCGYREGVALAARMLGQMAASPLRDAVEGGFFRYSTMRDWSEPHYERMLYDNALLLEAYVRADALGFDGSAEVASGVADFLLDVLQLPGGGFASAQNSESEVDGRWTEGEYYALSVERRAEQVPPSLDDKVLAGWNGLAIGALAHAGVALDRADLIAAATRAADYLLEQHVGAGVDGALVRMSIDGKRSAARATLEDYGMLSAGLLRLALANGAVRYAEAGRALLDATLAGTAGIPFTVPGGADPVLQANGLALPLDPSEGAYPSGLSACALTAELLFSLTGERRYRDAASGMAAFTAERALQHPLGFGASLELLAALSAPQEQLVMVLPDGASIPGSPLLDQARTHPASLTAWVTESQGVALADAGFGLFAARPCLDGKPTAYRCREMVCRMPTTDAL